MKRLFTLLAGLALIVPATAQSCMAGWNYFMPVTVSNANSSVLTNHQVLLTINTAALVASGHMQADGDDIRFYSSSVCCVEYPYFIDSGMNSVSTKIWVKVPSVPAMGSTMFNMYYGNAAATAGSNGEATFSLFEDYSGPNFKFPMVCGTTGTATPNAGSMTYAWSNHSMWMSDTVFQLSDVYTAEAFVTAQSGNWPSISFIKTSDLRGYGIMRANSGAGIAETVTSQTTYCMSRNWTTAAGSSSTTAGVWSVTWVATGNVQGSYPGLGTLSHVSANPTHTKNAPLKLIIGGCESGAGSMTIDWVRVRKYAAIAPSSSVGSEFVYTSTPAAGGFLGADQNICTGQNIVLDASAYGFTSYLWSTGSTSPSITVNTPGSYWVQGTSSMSCAMRDTIVLNPLPPAAAGTISGANAICNGFSTALSTSSNVGTVDWYQFNGSSYIPLGSGQSVNTGPLSVAGTYSFVAVATGSCDSDTSAFYVVNVDATSNAGTISMPSDLCVNSTATMSTSGHSGAIDWYEFDGNNYILLAGNTTSYTTSPFTTAGTFSVVAVAGGACPDDTSALVTAVIHAQPTPTVTSGVNMACLNDGNVSLTGSPSGGTFSGPGVSGNAFSPLNAGIGNHTIMYSYTDAFGCMGTATTVVTVNLCTDIPAQSGVNGFSVQPNPNAGMFTLTSAATYGPTVVEVVDITGRVVYTSQQNNINAGSSLQINLTNEAEGMYFVKVTTAEARTVIPVSIAH